MTVENLVQKTTKNQTIRPAAHTATATGISVDTAGFTTVTFIVDVGTIPDGQYDLEFQDGLTSGGTFAAIANDFMIGDTEQSLDETNHEQIFHTGIKPQHHRRFVRCVATMSDNPAGSLFGVHVELSGARHLPTDATQL